MTEEISAAGGRLSPTALPRSSLQVLVGAEAASLLSAILTSAWSRTFYPRASSSSGASSVKMGSRFDVRSAFTTR